MSVILVCISMMHTRSHAHPHASAHFIVLNWCAAIMCLVDKPIVRNLLDEKSRTGQARAQVIQSHTRLH